MELNHSTIVVVDTSVLINFLCIDRMDLIAAHSHS
jgi:predicted nucleic acid-binding protein